MTQTRKCLQSALVDTYVDISLGVIKCALIQTKTQMLSEQKPLKVNLTT